MQVQSLGNLNLIPETMKASALKHSPVLPRAALLGLGLLLAPALQAAAAKNPVGKMYVAILGGAAELAGDDQITDLQKKTAHSVNGAVLETKRSGTKETGNEEKADYSAMVFSNGTGMYVDPDTRLNVRKFEQEPFKPNRTDMDVEPSVSHTQTVLDRGTIGLCTPKMSAGSTMIYQTPLGAVNVRGRRVVIESNEEYTRVAMIEGESTVRSGDGNALDLGGQVLRAGQQAFIRRGTAGQPPVIQIETIPPSAMAALDDKVAMACIAKKSVYFEAVDRSVGSGGDGATDSLVAGAAADKQGDDNTNNSGVSAFDDTPAQRIVAVEVVPVKLPVEFTVSPARAVK
jgi:hypothetical protein